MCWQITAIRNGRSILIVSDTTSAVVADGEGAEAINGGATVTISNRYDSVMLTAYDHYSKARCKLLLIRFLSFARIKIRPKSIGFSFPFQNSSHGITVILEFPEI